MQSLSTEDYLKAIYHASQSDRGTVATTSIANKIGAKPSSVTDMFKKLSEQKLVKYEKYQGVSLTNEGVKTCLLYTSPSPRDATLSRMPSSA